ncbi:MAG: hypothetical protein ACPHX8_08415 [Candidatus Poseidoniaceae archaeon]
MAYRLWLPHRTLFRGKSPLGFEALLERAPGGAHQGPTFHPQGFFATQRP